MDRGAWWARVYGVTESNMNEHVMDDTVDSIGHTYRNIYRHNSEPLAFNHWEYLFKLLRLYVKTLRKTHSKCWKKKIYGSEG